MAITAGLIILIAWTAPVPLPSIKTVRVHWYRITKPLAEFSERMENAVSALESTTPGRPGEFYGTELELGLGFPLSDTVMFEVQVPDLAVGQKPPRYYWRGRVYDYFAQDQWYTTGTIREEYSPQNPAPAIEQNAGGTLSRFIFNAGESKFALMYAPQQLVWVSRGGSFLAAPAGEKKDVFSWSASPTLLPGETYQVDSVLSNPNIEQLREVGVEYPACFTSSFLQLSTDFSTCILY